MVHNLEVTNQEATLKMNMVERAYIHIQSNICFESRRI